MTREAEIVFDELMEVAVGKEITHLAADTSPAWESSRRDLLGIVLRSQAGLPCNVGTIPAQQRCQAD